MMAIKSVLMLAFYIGVFNINKIAGNKISKSEQYCKNINTKYPTNMSTLVDKFPHMAAIDCTDSDSFDKNTFYTKHCAGVLISEKYVLTTAQCINFYDKEKGHVNKIRLGSKNIESNDTNIQSIKAAKLIPHPDFKKKSFLDNDIALIELEQEVKITDHVRPACLEIDKKDYPSLIATSYKFLGYYKELTNWTYSELAYDECKKVFENDLENDECVCIRDLPDNSTELTSGDPLQIIDSNYGYKIVGVTSFNDLDIPKTYGCSRISHYINWIESIVWTKAS